MNAQEIRNAILDIEMANPEIGNIPLHQLYVPKSHALAMCTHCLFVVGGNGTGKTFWWRALQDPAARKEMYVAARSSDAHSILNYNTQVFSGFGPAESEEWHPSAETMVQLVREGHDPYNIWKAILEWRAACTIQSEIVGVLDASSWSKRVEFFTDLNDTSFNLIGLFVGLRDPSKPLPRPPFAARSAVWVFDGLNFPDKYIQTQLLNGLARLAIALRNSSSNAFLKLFLSPEQFRQISGTTTSKATTRTLEWHESHLHGLLWSLLGNHPTHGRSIREVVCNHLEVQDVIERGSSKWNPPQQLQFDLKVQETAMRLLACDHNGTPRRSTPYRTLGCYLQDEHKVVTPRSFISAFIGAAEDTATHYSEHDRAIHWMSFRAGYRAAAQVRVEEMSEHKWMFELLEPLRGLQNPFTFHELQDVWMRSDDAVDVESAVDRLERIGAMRRMTTENITLAEPYRLAFGVGRKGGIALKNAVT